VAERVRVWDWETELAEREKTGQGAAKPVGSGEGLEQAARAGMFMLSTPSTALKKIAKLHLGYKERFDGMVWYLIFVMYLNYRMDSRLRGNDKTAYGLGTGGRDGILEALGGRGKGVGVAATMDTLTMAEPSNWPFCFKASTVRLWVVAADRATVVSTVVPAPW